MAITMMKAIERVTKMKHLRCVLIAPISAAVGASHYRLWAMEGTGTHLCPVIHDGADNVL